MEHHHHHAPAVAKAQGAGAWESLREYFSQLDFMPHGHCYLWKPGLVWSHVVSDTLIGLSYLCISVTLYLLIRRVRIPFHGIIIAFGLFIGACGATHFMEVWNLWNADYWFSAWIKVITAGASVVTALWLLKLRDPIYSLAQATKLAEERRRDLEDLTRNLELRVEERTLELSEAVATRDQFLSVASHELKTPLTTMKLQTQLKARKFREGKVTQDGYEKFFRSMDEQIVRLTNLVDDMLDISHIQRGEFRLNRTVDDLVTTINEVLENMRPLIEAKGGSLSFVAPERVDISMDKYRIAQVLDNFLTNAEKYAPGTPVQIHVSLSEDFARVSVTDGGPGIPPELSLRVFEKFERAISANEVSGLGLGLFISRTIVAAHGGKIWMENMPDKGCKFSFELPR